MRFEKYHGLGNDFIIFNYEDVKTKDLSKLAIKSCNRNFGVGGDGMIVYEKKESLENPNGEIIMRFYNADGSSALMCGNGIRCFTHYLKNNNLFVGDKVEITTGAGVMRVSVYEQEKFMVRVNMGKPKFDKKNIPMKLDVGEESCKEDKYFEKKLIIDEKTFKVSSLFMGVTHTVVYVEDLKKVDIERVGKAIEKNSLYPKGTNVNFVQIISPEDVEVVTWERGAGLTLACGTGACAVGVVSNLLGKTKKNIKVKVPGGELFIEIGEDIFMTGPSEQVIVGEFLL